MEIYPSEARKIILNEHADLSTQLDTIEASMAQKKFPELKTQLDKFAEAFKVHASHEEEILLPILREIDAWGEQRAINKQNEHIEQQKLIEQLSGFVLTLPENQLGTKIQEFIALFRKDIEEENKMFLDPNLLKDDPINVNFSG